MELVSRTAKLAPYARRVKANTGFAASYFYEPDHYDPAELGSLFVVIEVLASKQSEEVVDLVIQTMADHYYSLKAHDEELDPGAQFEAAVKALNKELLEYTNRGNATWVGKMSAVIAVLAGGELHLTQAGSAEAYLYRGTQGTLISQGLATREPFRPGKTFTNFASGILKPDDKVLLTTPALMHQVTKKELPQIMRENSANSAIQKLSEQLHPDATAERIAALVIEVTTAELMSMNSLPDEPEEVLVGQPPTLAASIRPMAAPVARQALGAAQTASDLLFKFGRQVLLPFARKVGRILVALWGQIVRLTSLSVAWSRERVHHLRHR